MLYIFYICLPTASTVIVILMLAFCPICLNPYLFLLTRVCYPQTPPPMRLHYSEAHWSWVHSQWHLPSAVHDCGEICLNLQGTVLNGSHWSTFAWHCNWQSQSAYHGPGDGQTLILQVRWGGMSLIDWQAVIESLGHYKTISAGAQYCVGEWAPVQWCFCSSVCVCVCVCIGVFVNVGGHLYTDYPLHLECGDS